MNLLLVAVLVMMVVSAVLLVAILLDIPILRGGGMDQRVRTLVASQRAVQTETEAIRQQSRASAFARASDENPNTIKTTGARLTLTKKLRYAQWKTAPLTFRVFELGIAVIAVMLSSLVLTSVFVPFTACLGPLVMHSLLNRAMNARFSAFDKDYAAFLLSIVGLLKTGMTPMTAIESAAEGLEPGSLLRIEVEVMIERTRYGVPEDASIGSFAENINHPEIELFVQALLLSRAVGGTLSDTLERLSRQTRKRQHFRNSAKSQVALQRGSIVTIIVLLAALEGFLYFTFPEAVVGVFKDKRGFLIWQFAVSVILLGVYWSRRVTDMRL